MIRKFTNFVNEVYCNYNKMIDYDILETLTAQELEDSTFKFLNKNFIGWMAIDSLREYLVHITEWKSNQIFLFDEIYWNNEHRMLQGSSARFNYSDIHKIKIKGIKEKPFDPNDPYGEEIWLGESKKSKRMASSRIKMADVDPYGEEDWGWNVKINDEDFKGKYIIFKRGVLDIRDYYFGLLKSHYQVYATHGFSYDLNRIKRQILPLNEREIDRIKNNKIQLVPYMVGYKYNAYGNAERVPYSELKKGCFFLDKKYMDNYLYINESKVNENFKVGDSILCVYDKYPNLTGEIVFVDDSHFNSYTVKLDREVKGKLFYPIKSEKALKITDDERYELCKKFDKDKEELRLINIDIDPYGEEIWNENKINEYVEFNKYSDELEGKS
jgi:hypothetical protein